MDGEFARLERQTGWRVQEHARLIDGVWTAHAAIPVSYPEAGHTDCSPLEDDSFWFRHRNRAIENLLQPTGRPAALWEIGAGNGVVAAHLRDAGIDTVAVEPAQGGARNAAARGLPTVCAPLEALRLPAASLPAIGCFDVLEHLANPAALLAEMHRVLVPGGLLALAVPALPWLWSQADEYAGHFRRYTRSGLDRDVGAAGFEGIHSHYEMATLVPALFLLRSLPWRLGHRADPRAHRSRMRRQLAPRSRLVDAVLSAVLRSEARLRPWLPLPWGTSVLALYRKR